MIKDFHIHFYYNELTLEKAKLRATQTATKFSLELGRFHEKNVGPHPMWSVQLLVPTSKFGDVFSWVVLNRDGLIIFTHPNTGDDLKDHTDHAIWMGKSLDLNLSIFKREL